MEVLYYTVGVIGSFKILNDLFKPKEKIEVIIEEEEYDGDNEDEHYKKYFNADGSPITTFEYDREMYLANDHYASCIDDKIVASGYYYDEEYESEDECPKATFEYDREMYMSNDAYATMVDKKMVENGEKWYDEEYEPDYGQYCEIESEEKRAE